MSVILFAACYLTLVVSSNECGVAPDDGGGSEPKAKTEAVPPKAKSPNVLKEPEKEIKLNEIKVQEMYSMELVEEKNGCKIYKVKEVNSYLAWYYYVISCTKNDITDVEIPTHHNISFLYNK